MSSDASNDEPEAQKPELATEAAGGGPGSGMKTTLGFWNDEPEDDNPLEWELGG